MEIDPAALAWRDAYKLLIGSVLPRPIAFVSTVSPAGAPNLAPFSFFNGICAEPFCIAFAPMRRGGDGGKKDTLRNIEDTGEFVVNVVTVPMGAAMNETATDFPPEVNEFERGGFTPVPSTVVRPPRVAESPINMECRLLHLLHLGDQPGGGSLVVGQVLRLHVQDELVQNYRVDFQRWQPLARLAGDWYCGLGDLFTMARKPLP